MIEFKASLTPYDADKQTGLALTITIYDDRIRQAKLIDKPLADVSLLDAMQILQEVAQEIINKLQFG